MITWTAEAEKMVAKAPIFVRKKIRARIEERAHSEGVAEITAAFLKGFMPGHGGTAAPATRGISYYFANTGGEPIYAGFSSSVGVHAGMSGEPVEEPALAEVWPAVAAASDPSPQRALYLHIPFCLARCKFCAFYASRTRNDELEQYAHVLLQELELMAASPFVASSPINAVYFGGGTPTDLPAGSLRTLLTHLRTYWPLANDCEITVEGRIHGFSDEKVSACLECGVNRFSFGVQSFDTRIRRQMGRIESRDSLLARISEIGWHNHAAISVDLIYGLPDQTDDIWRADLRAAYETGAIDSVSLYNLKLLPGTPIRAESEAGTYGAPADMRRQADMYLLARELYSRLNVRRLSLRHWAFSHRERSLYNYIPKYGYTCIPAGNGAGGRIGEYRVFQKCSNDEYAATVGRGMKPVSMALRVPPEDALSGEMIGTLEQYMRLDIGRLEQRHNRAGLCAALAPLLEQWHEAGMIHRTGDTFSLTPAGEFWNVHIAQNLIDFITHLPS